MTPGEARPASAVSGIGDRPGSSSAPAATSAPFGAGSAGASGTASASGTSSGMPPGTPAGTPAAAPSIIGYLDYVRTVEAAQAYKRVALDRLDVQPGQAVLDVGCGPGDDLRDLAARVGTGGRAVGIDSDQQMIAEAWRRVGQRRASPHVEFRVGDAHALPFENAGFDRCRCDRMLQHVTMPHAVIAEMVRVARSGARLVASEPDWETLTLDTPERAATRVIVQFIADRVVRHGWIGRQLPRLFHAAGLVDVQIDPVAMTVTSFQAANTMWALARNAALCRDAGAIAPAAMDAWLHDLEEAGRDARFLGAQLGFVVSGRKP